MKRVSLIIGLFVILTCQVTANQEAPEVNQQEIVNKAFFADSQQAALDWLASMDQGDYDKTWENASTTLKLTVPKHRWKKMMEKLRKPLGAANERTLQLQAPAQDPKNLPKGHYMVLFYQTSFSGRPEANELVTMVLESDSKWRVLTYHVR